MSHIFSFFRELDFGVMPLNSSNVPAAGPRQLDSGLPRNISLSDMPIHPQATTMFNGPFPSRPVSYIYLFILHRLWFFPFTELAERTRKFSNL